MVKKLIVYHCKFRPKSYINFISFEVLFKTIPTTDMDCVKCDDTQLVTSTPSNQISNGPNLNANFYFYLNLKYQT